MDNADFNSWLAINNNTGLTTLQLKEQYLVEWLNKNCDNYYPDELVDELFNIMISLDMDQYVNSSFDSKNLVLYSGQSSDGVYYHTTLEGSPQINANYVLANNTEMADFALFKLDSWAQSKYNKDSITYDKFMSKSSGKFCERAVITHSSGNVLALINSPVSDSVWIKYELPALCEECDHVTMINGIDFELLGNKAKNNNNMDYWEISDCIDANRL